MATRKRVICFFTFAVLFITLVQGKVFGFSFAVMSDPQYRSESWINSLTEARDIMDNADTKFSHAKFILVTGDITPIDVMYGEYKKIFKGKGDTPVFLPVIGNHEFDDAGGMPGGMPPAQGGPSPMGAPQGQGGTPGTEITGRGDNGQQSPRAGQQGPGTPPGMGSPQGQGGTPGMGGPPGMGGGGDTGDPDIIDVEFIGNTIIPLIPKVVRFNEKSCSYYYDHENVRVISLDGYGNEIGSQGIINDKGKAWAEEVIKSAPDAIDHIFIAFHAPAFPRVRHTHDSFSADPEKRNAFWNMLITYRDRVRAVFVGHTHYYCRMRILDPAGAGANDFSAYPDEEGGIYQINSGSTGSGMKNTFLMVTVDGKSVYFRAYEAENGADQPFSIKDEWNIPAVLQAK